jgi:hypothetical protein
MTRMKKLFVTILLVASTLYSSAAIHIHTDATDYRAGERMWFRTYFLDSDMLPDTAVLMAVVELIEPEGVVAKRVKVMRMDDIFSGYIDIPSHAEAGQYLVRAYARGMESHMEQAGKQIIYIHGRISGANRSDSIVQVDESNDSITAQRVAMPLSVRNINGIHEIAIDTTYLQPGERVLVSASVTDRYALSRHPQWTIMQSVAWMPDSSILFSDVQGTAIHGTVETPGRRKPVKGAVVNLIIPEIYHYASDTTDEFGHFAFADEVVPDGMNVLLMAFRPNGEQNVVIGIEEESFPPYEGTLPALLRLQGEKRVPVTELGDIADSVTLEEIEVTAERRIKESSVEQQTRNLADVSFGMNKIMEYSATCLHDLLRRVPGVNVVDEKCYIRGAHSIYAKNPAAIAINGVIQEGDYDLDLIPMQDIARLDIFKSGTTVIWGSRGGAGVISIILKDGSEVPQQADPSNLKRLKPLGWQQPAEFFVQIPSDNTHRAGTLLWNPNVQSPVLRFTDGGAATIYDVVIEGVTTHGRLIHEHQEITVPLHN